MIIKTTYPNIKVEEIKPEVILVKHANGNAVKFRTSLENFLNSKSVVRRLNYFDKYGVMAGYDLGKKEK